MPLALVLVESAQRDSNEHKNLSKVINKLANRGGNPYHGIISCIRIGKSFWNPSHLFFKLFLHEFHGNSILFLSPSFLVRRRKNMNPNSKKEKIHMIHYYFIHFYHARKECTYLCVEMKWIWCSNSR